MQPLRILIADDDDIVRENLFTLLSSQDDIKVVATAKDGYEAIHIVDKYSIDIAILDVEMPKIDGIKAARIIHSRYPDITLVMYTAFAHPDFLPRALSAGAKGFLTKDIPISAMPMLLHQAVEGIVILGSKPIRIITNYYLQNIEHASSLQSFLDSTAQLTPSLRRVFDLLVQALPNKEIANRLYLNESSVRMYVTQILSITGCSSRTELVLKAANAGYKPH